MFPVNLHVLLYTDLNKILSPEKNKSSESQVFRLIAIFDTVFWKKIKRQVPL